jgi:hypothetical protein
MSYAIEGNANSSSRDGILPSYYIRVHTHLLCLATYPQHTFIQYANARQFVPMTTTNCVIESSHSQLQNFLYKRISGENDIVSKEWKTGIIINIQERRKITFFPVLNLSTTPWRRMGSACRDPHFFDFSTNYSWVVSFTPRPLYPRERAPGTHSIGWVEPRIGLDDVEDRNFLTYRDTGTQTSTPWSFSP